MDLGDSTYMVWARVPHGWTVYVHAKRGHGRAARRQLLGCYHLHVAPGHERPPSLVRALARALEDGSGTHVTTDPTKWAREPRGAVGGSGDNPQR